MDSLDSKDIFRGCTLAGAGAATLTVAPKILRFWGRGIGQRSRSNHHLQIIYKSVSVIVDFIDNRSFGNIQYFSTIQTGVCMSARSCSR